MTPIANFNPTAPEAQAHRDNRGGISIQVAADELRRANMIQALVNARSVEDLKPLLQALIVRT